MAVYRLTLGGLVELMEPMELLEARLRFSAVTGSLLRKCTPASELVCGVRRLGNLTLTRAMENSYSPFAE